MKKLITITLLTVFSFIAKAQWIQQNSGTTENLNSVYFINSDTGWACGWNGEIIKTTNRGMTWSEQNSNTSLVLNKIQFVDPDNGWACGYNQLLRTTNGGASWSNGSIPISDFQFIDADTGWLIIDSLIYISTDSGETWMLQYSSTQLLESLYFINQNTGWVIGGIASEVLKTTDGGINWLPYPGNFSGAPMRMKFVNALTGWTSHNTLGSSQISKTTDGGMTWTEQFFDNTRFIHSIDFRNSEVGYAAGYRMLVPPNPNRDFVLITTDGGVNWFEQYYDVGRLNSVFFVNDSLGWAVGDNGKIIHTINGGTPVELISFTASTVDKKVSLEWSTASEINNHGFEIERSKMSNANSEMWEKIGFVKGLGTTTEIHSYSFVDRNLLPGKYHYRLKQIDFDGSFEYSNIVEAEVNVPIEFSLSQNYPNPFNPTTKIKFTIPGAILSEAKNLFVTLKVYDVLGTEIVTLVNEEKSQGEYEVEFDASQLSSGIYFYKLQTENFSETKKMQVIK